jgi:hypothetical protein
MAMAAGKLSFLSFPDMPRGASGQMGDKLNALCWTLDGKALDYFVILYNSGEVQSYASLYDKLEARFGNQISPEAAQGQFYQVFQKPGESLDDFADR